MEGYFPNVTLRTQDGESIRFYDDALKGKVVVIQFLFTACSSVCPRATANLAAVQRALGSRVGRDVFLFSITLDPERDTPETLKSYAREVGAGPGWTFLTGRFEDIELLRTRLGFTDPDPAVDADRMQHAGLFLYGNESLGRWAMIPAQLEPDEIVKAVRRVMSRPRR